MQQWCAGLHRQDWIEDRRQNLVFHMQSPAAGVGRGLGLRHDGCDPLPDKARNIVEQHHVIGINEMILMERGAEQAFGNIFPSIDRYNTRHGQRRVTVDGNDPRVRMRRAQHLQVQQSINRDIHGIPRLTGHYGIGERIG